MVETDRQPSSWTDSSSDAMAYVTASPYIGLFLVLLVGWGLQSFGAAMLAGLAVFSETVVGVALVVAGGFLLFASGVAVLYTIVRDAVAAATETQEP